MMQYNRFDLETEIQNVWNTEKDLDTVLYRILDSSDGPCSVDVLSNMILGLKELHRSRCLKLWDVFEIMLKEGRFVSDNQKDIFEEIKKL